MNTQTKTCCFGALALLIPVLGAQALAAQSWQEDRLPAPSEWQQTAGLQDRVHIYSALPEDTADRAPDAPSGRVQKVMLAGEAVTTDEGEESADDDCD